MTALFLLRYVCMDTAHGKASVRFHHVKPKGVRMTPPTYQILIGGEWRSADSGAHFETHKLGDLIAAQAEQLAQAEVRDNGKLIAEMLGQTRYVPQWYYYHGGLADKIEGGVLPIDKTGVFNFTRWESLGVVAAIVPWNSPYG
jgi:hypothetical protein